MPREDLIGIAESSQIKSFKLGEVLFNEGDEADSLHLIRKGSVSVSKRLGGRSVVLNYVATGNYVGEMGLVSNAPRSATVTAAVACETLSSRLPLSQNLRIELRKMSVLPKPGPVVASCSFFLSKV